LKKNLLFLLGILLSVLAVIGLIATAGAFHNSLILAFGAPFVEKLPVVAWCILGAGVLLAATGMARAFRRSAASHATELQTARNLNGPAEIRAELARWVQDRPQLRALLETAREQLDSVGRKRSRAASLFATMAVPFERQTMEAIDSVEGSICKRVKLIICRAILCDPEEVGANEVANHQAAIRDFLETNQKTIAACEDLLAQIVKNNEGKQRDSQAEDFANITSLIAVLYDLNAQNIRN